MNSLSPRAGKGIFSLREMCLLAILAALMAAGQVAMAPLPNIEPVSFFIILGALLFGYKVLFSVYIFVLVEGLIYGFGIWYVSYLYIWAILAVISVLLRKTEGRLMWAIISGFFGLIFGLLCALPYLFISGPAAALAFYIKGIPFDLLHCAGNFVITFVLLPPCLRITKKLL